VCAEGDACADDHHEAARKVRHQEAIHDQSHARAKSLGRARSR
jgi:hypothetical protein